MTDQEKKINELLTEHKQALNEYRMWDQKVKELLKGRRANDLQPDDMAAYRDAAEQRDIAYDRMRHLERALLDNIPGASTGPFPAIDPNDLD